MTKNIITRLPKRGDIVARKINNISGYVYGKEDTVYFKLDSFDLSEIDTTVYEIIGVVAWRFYDEVLVVFKTNVSKKYCSRAWWTLSGYHLDGTEHSFTLQLRFASSTPAWDTAVNKTISYTASTADEFITALNNAFAADSDFIAQDWYARNDGDANNPVITVHCNNIDYRQCAYNKAASGTDITMSGALPDVSYTSSMRRKNGGVGSKGCSASFERYVYYRDNDTIETLTSQAPVKTTEYPVYRGTYLNSAYCSNLRSVYGDGREGWIKYMKSCKPVRETDYGAHSVHNGKELGKQYGTKMYVSSTQTTPASMMPASEYCYNLPNYIQDLKTVAVGEFWLPTTQELDYIMQDVKYNAINDRNADVLNKALFKIGGLAVSNGSSWWSSVRCNTYGAWIVYGYFGGFHDGHMYFSNQALPVSLFKL